MCEGLEYHFEMAKHKRIKILDIDNNKDDVDVVDVIVVSAIVECFLLIWKWMEHVSLNGKGKRAMNERGRECANKCSSAHPREKGYVECIDSNGKYKRNGLAKLL